MPNGFGRRFYFGRGMGFGFRGSSPPWPYVGLGRGGLPRCGYFLGAWMHTPWVYRQPYYDVGTPFVPGYAPSTPPVTREEELSYLRDQAEAIKEQLEEIEARMRDLETGK